MSRYIIMTASAQMPNSCRGIYRRVAVVELTPGFTKTPKMISERAIGIKRIVETWERLNVGKTHRCAYQVALMEADELIQQLEENNVS